MQVKKQKLELDMEQRTGSRLGKEYVKAVYYHPVHLISLHSTCAGIKIARRNISNLWYTDDTTLMAESEKN